MKELLQWWNLLFVLPFSAGLMYLFSMMSGIMGTEHDADADVDHDLDHGIEHSADVGHGHRDAGHNGEHEQSALSRALSSLGVGKVPLSVVVMTFCFIWGFAGWASNMLLKPVLGLPQLFIIPSLAIAVVSSVSLTSLISRLVAEVMPSTETYATSAKDLIGRRAETRFAINETFGRAIVIDDYGNRQEITCVVPAGEPMVSDGQFVIIMSYDRDRQAYLVRPDPLETRGVLASSATNHRREIIQ